MKKTNMRRLSSFLSVLFLTSLSSTSYAMDESKDSKDPVSQVSSVQSSNISSLLNSAKTWTKDKWSKAKAKLNISNDDKQKTEKKEGPDYIDKNGKIVYKKGLLHYFGKAQGDPLVSAAYLEAQIAYMEGYFNVITNLSSYLEADIKSREQETVVASEDRKSRSLELPVDLFGFWKLGSQDRKDSRKLRLPLDVIMSSEDLQRTLWDGIYSDNVVTCRAELEQRAKMNRNKDRKYYDEADVEKKASQQTLEDFETKFGKDDGKILFYKCLNASKKSPAVIKIQKVADFVGDKLYNAGKDTLCLAVKNYKATATLAGLYLAYQFLKG